ncbi:MAG: replicative DNA helicase [Oscillospiraceae bacterium]|nr:replicative DNA helicase [Oscillospiraceae bacterium]
MQSMQPMGDLPDISGKIPYNLEAEQSVLGAILVDPTCLPEILEQLRPDNFYRPQHAEIFALMSKMFLSGETLDFVTVLNRVRAENIFESDADAKMYLSQLVDIVPSISNINAYVGIVLDKYIGRMLVRASQEIIAEAADGQGDAQMLLDSAEQKVYDIRQGRGTKGITHISESALATFDRLQKLSGKDRDQYLGISTGYSELDTILTGLNKSDLLIVAGRPGMGKTTFALNIAANVAFEQKRTVVVFSLEMSSEQLTSKIFSSQAAISSKAFRTGQMSSNEWVRLIETIQVVSKSPIYMDDTSSITVAEMKAKLRRIPDLGLVVIDYLQLMTSGSGGKRSENRVQEVSDITRSLKIMARELNVPIIVCSQLSRGVAGRQDKRPMLSDLRESGSIEQDADIVMMIHREAYFDQNAENGNLAELIVAKNRHGETATVNLGWDGVHSRFQQVDTIHAD